MSTSKTLLKKIASFAGKPMDPTTHLIDTRFFRALVFGPVAIGIGLAISVSLTTPADMDWTFTGFNTFIQMFKLPIGVAGMAIPLGALVASHHRSIQSARTIEAQESQNIFSNYTKHREYFGKHLDEENLLNGENCYSAPNKSIYKVLFPYASEGELSPHIDFKNKEKIKELIDLTIFSAERITWKSQVDLPNFEACLEQLSRLIEAEFKVNSKVELMNLDIERAIFETRRLITTIDHVYSAATFLTNTDQTEVLLEWKSYLNQVISIFIKVRNFQLAETIIKDLAKNASRAGQPTITTDHKKQIIPLLRPQIKQKLEEIKKRHGSNPNINELIKSLIRYQER